jgi:hypothetical protein
VECAAVDFFRSGRELGIRIGVGAILL